MADTKISALPAATAAAAGNELPINEAGTSKKLTVNQIQDYLLKRAAAATMAAGDFCTWLVLAANSGDITGLSLTTVMSITAVPVGRYHFKCQLIYQTSATTTGKGVAVNFTGTLTQFLVEERTQTTGQTAATNAASQVSATAAGNTYEAQGSRTKNVLIGAVSVSVDAANTDMMATIEGFMVVSVQGDLEIKLEAELSALVVRAMQGSFLELKRLS